MRIAITIAIAPRDAITSAIAIRIAITIASAIRAAITITINGYGTVLIANQLIVALFGSSWDVNLYTLSSGFQAINREIFCFYIDHYSSSSTSPVPLHQSHSSMRVSMDPTSRLLLCGMA
jgi:hypothetical protein